MVVIKWTFEGNELNLGLGTLLIWIGNQSAKSKYEFFFEAYFSNLSHFLRPTGTFL
jgi:hypothetical protein